jgi:hypothetical protein
VPNVSTITARQLSVYWPRRCLQGGKLDEHLCHVALMSNRLWPQLRYECEVVHRIVTVDDH